MSFYREDLAWVHDSGFSGFVRNAVPGLLHILRTHNIRKGLVIDLGCGSGLWARELTRSGYEVFGVDISPAMLRLAGKRSPKGRFVQASLFEVELPRCAAVTATGECLNYLFDKSNANLRLGRFFRRVYQALTPGGVLVFDVATPGRVPHPTERFFHGQDWAILVYTEENPSRRLLTRRMIIFRKVGKRWRRSLEIHEQKLYSVQLVRRELRRAGFKVKSRNGYTSRPLGPGMRVFTACRPAIDSLS